MRVPYTNFQLMFRSNAQDEMFQVAKVLDQGDMILGAQVELFEEEFSEYQGGTYSIGVANGTESLVLMMKALDIGPGDEVITVPNSWISSASSIALVGAKPVFVDVGPDQLMDPNHLEFAITRRTKAIMPVHLSGRLCAMDAILEIAKHHKIQVIEDAAQAVGVKNAGSFGVMGSFSLHPLKSLGGCGDGGIISTHDKGLETKLKLLRNHGLKNRDEVIVWGHNSRLDTIQAAILRLRLKRLPQVIAQRRHFASIYHSRLKDIVTCPIDEGHSYHTFTIQCDKRDDLRTFLKAQDIETKVHYPVPIHLQRCADSLNYQAGDFPNVELQAQRILSLPINEYLSQEQVEHTARAIEVFYS